MTLKHTRISRCKKWSSRWSLAGWVCLTVCFLGFAGCGQAPSADRSAIELEFPDENGGAAASDPAGPASVLRPGERFVFRRVLKTGLTQPGGVEPLLTRATSEVEFSITFEGHSIPPVHAEESELGPASRTASLSARQFHLRFQHCRQTVEFPDGTSERFDSMENSLTPAVGTVGCHGLMGNGFRFWLSTRGELLAIDDFPAFLDRCSQALPEGPARQQFREDLEETWGSENPALVLADLVGLIPIRASEVGQRWVESRTLAPTERQQSATEYALVASEASQESLEWSGRQTTRGTVQSDARLRIRSLGADWQGSARIETRSGFCLDLLETQQSRMAVQTPSGREFVQSRTTTLRIERVMVPADAGAAGAGLAGSDESARTRRISRSAERDTR